MSPWSSQRSLQLGNHLFLNNSVFTLPPRHSRGSQQGGCWHRGFVLPAGLSIPDDALDSRLRPGPRKCPPTTHLVLAPSPYPLLPTIIQRASPQLTLNLLLPFGDWGLQTLASGSLSLLLCPCSPQGPRRPAHSLHHNNHSFGVA